VAHVGPEQACLRSNEGLRLWVSWDQDAARLLPPASSAPEEEPDMRTTIERAVAQHP